MKKIDKDPFSNGTEFMLWNEHNCDKCVKASNYNEKLCRYTNADKDNMPKCSIQRDILLRMANDELIKQKTIDICENFTWKGVLCPYLQMERKKYTKKVNNQLSIEL